MRPLIRNDRLIAALLFLAVFASRIPFRTRMLYAWDSVLYTRAIKNFNVAAGSPQPPGHIFYVGLVWLVNRITGDPNAAMVWISAFFAGASVAMLYLLGRTMFSRAVGLAAAALLATSLSFWVYSEVAYPYTLLAFLSTALAALIYKTWEGKSAWVLPAALVLGLAAGFREELLPFLFPAVVVGWLRQPPLRIAAAVALMALAALSWYIPAALLSGGLAAYQNASSAQTSYLINYSSVFGAGKAALAANLDAFFRFLGWAAAAGAPLLAAFLAALPFSRFRQTGSGRRLLFLAAWSLPSILFYIFIHIGEYGYVFSFLPAALLAAAWGGSRFGEIINEKRPRVSAARGFAIITAPLVLANLLLFLVFSPPMSASRLAARDNLLKSKVETIKRHFSPAATVIVSVFDENEVDYYLPGYRHFGLDPMSQQRAVFALGPDVRQVVIFDEYLHPPGGDPGGSLPLGLDQTLKFLYRTPGQTEAVLDWRKREVALENGSRA